MEYRTQRTQPVDQALAQRLLVENKIDRSDEDNRSAQEILLGAGVLQLENPGIMFPPDTFDDRKQQEMLKLGFATLDCEAVQVLRKIVEVQVSEDF